MQLPFGDSTAQSGRIATVMDEAGAGFRRSDRIGVVETNDQRPSNANIVGGATAVAGLLAAGVVAIGQARRRRRSDRGARGRLRTAKKTLMKKGESLPIDSGRAADLAASALSIGKDQAAAARTRGKKQTKRVIERARDIDAAAASTAASGATRKLRAGVRSTADAGTEKGLVVADTAKERMLQVSSQATESAQALAAHAAAAAIAGSDRAREASSVLVDAAREKAPQVAHRINDDVIPTLRDIAAQAAGMAIELWQTTREKATDAASTAPSFPKVDGSHAVEASAERLRQATSTVSGKAGAVGERAKDASRRAADATVDTSKDTGALLFWAGAAAGLVFYALLSEERREQLTRTATAVTGQVQELIKDFQGYDDEF